MTVSLIFRLVQISFFLRFQFKSLTSSSVWASQIRVLLLSCFFPVSHHVFVIAVSPTVLIPLSILSLALVVAFDLSYWVSFCGHGVRWCLSFSPQCTHKFPETLQSFIVWPSFKHLKHYKKPLVHFHSICRSSVQFCKRYILFQIWFSNFH